MSDQEFPPETGDDALAAQLARMERMLAEQAARLHVIERQLGIWRPAAQTARPFGQGATPANGQRDAPTAAPPFSVTDATTEQTAHTTNAPRSITTDAQTTTGAHADAPDHAPAAGYQPAWRTPAAQAASATQAANNAPAPVAAVTKAWGDLETLIAGKLFLWVGMIAGTLAVAFFLKLAFERQWIGPMGRVLLGGAAGCALLALAERLRLRGYQAYAYVLSGGGILILYLSVYASFSFYRLLSQPPAFALMAVVTATAVLLAARYDAYPIAVLGLIGGFMTPSLLATNVDNEVGLFGYIALLDAGVLALAYFKRWRSLNYLAFAATWALFAGWYLKFYDDTKLYPTLFFLTLFFVMFAALAVIHNVLKARPTRWFDISLLLTNATLYFATSYALLEDHQRLTAATFHLQGPHALLLALFFGLLYFIARQKHPADKLLTYSYVAAAVTFLTMAMAIQLDQLWVTIGWGIEALMLTWVGLRAEEDAPRFAAMPVFTVAVMHWFIVDMRDYGYGAGVSFQPLLNKRAVSCAVLVGVCAGITWLYRRYAERVQDDDRDILRSLFVLAGNTLALSLLTADLNDYFAQSATRTYAANHNPDVVENAHQFALTTLWTLYATAALATGLLRRLQALRYAALAALLYPITKLLLRDVYYYSAPWHVAVFNMTFLGFAIVVAALAFSVYAYTRAEHVDVRERSVATSALLASAHLVALAGLSVETMGYFNRAKALAWSLPDSWRAAARVENNKQLALSFIWTLYAACAFVMGLRRKFAALRYGALGLLAIAGAKILLVDATYYNAAWHAPLFNQTFAAFACFVAALFVVAHLYARSDATDAPEAARIAPFVTVAGHVCALVALSLETTGYFAAQRGGEAILAAAQLRDLRLARELSLSVLWAGYGGALLGFGFVRHNKLLRVLALALLGLTTGKVFFFDLSSLDKLYRIISFIVLGAILLAVSFLYQQRQQRTARAEEG